MNSRRLSVFLVLVTLTFTTAAPSQPRDRIAPDLRRAMAGMREDQFIRIIIRLRDQLPPGARAEALQVKEKKARQKAMAAALRRFAERAQVKVRAELKDLEGAGLVRAVKPLWISNVIGAEATLEGIARLARLEDVEYIKQDIKRQALQQAWGVTQINADDVWTLVPTGFNGSGVTVAVLDTGADLAHTDLVSRLWINAAEDTNADGQFTAADNNGVDDDANGYIDDVVGWDLGNSDNNPTDWHGHGSHVAGSVLGDGTGGTATGVAPGARLMVLSYSASLGSGQAEAWEGMQYALDNGADIINFSSGWKDAWAPDYATWRLNTDNLSDAGVLFVVAAGNDNPHDPAPGDVLTPARVPRALGVGATDNTDTIAAFSGNGPTSWQGVAGYSDYIWPPGLIKPDVSAPGVSVNSCNNGGGYVNGAAWSGTSMAAPHAAGVAALLLDKEPALLPHELRYIIRETAVDLGSAGADMAYGFGRVNALAAVNLAYPGAGPYDLSITGTSAVWTTTDIWVDNNDDGIEDDPVAMTTNHLYARVRNLGGRAVDNVEVKFYFADVGTIGISGFDPNNDGDPADGNFTYITSYRVPVLGPAGSNQATATVVVPWVVPVPTGDHWCVGVGIVAPAPPNAVEADRVNNRAFRNFFDIVIALSQVRALRFFVYPDPRKPMEPFDVVFDARRLPPGFDIDLHVDERLAKGWFERMQGFRIREPERLKNLPDDSVLQRAPREIAVRLTEREGRLRGVRAPDGKPVLVRLVLRAPARPPRPQKEDALLVIDTRRGEERVGGLTYRIRIDEGKKRGQ